MEIIKPGDLSKLKKIKQFECGKCGCIFTADKSEYEVKCQCHSEDSFLEECYVCKCPTCDSQVMWRKFCRMELWKQL